MDPAERERHWTVLMEQSLQGDARAYEELLTLLTIGLRGIVRSVLTVKISCRRFCWPCT